MKRIGCLALALCLLCMAGCGNQGEKKETQNTNQKLTYWVGINSSQITTISNYAELPMYQKLSEETGVEVEFMHPPTGQEAEQYNLLIASGDYPDMIERSWSTDAGGPGKAVADGIILPLDDAVKNYAPNYQALLEKNHELKKAFSTDNGQIFAFGGISVMPKLIPGGYFIRKDFLEQLHMEAPKSIEDWEAYFEGCKTQLGIETPFSTDSYRMNYAKLFSESFGIGSKYYVDAAGEVKYAPMQPEFKEYLTLMNRWFEKGYLDKGIFSNDGSMVESKILNSMTGSFYGFIGGTLGKLLAAAPDDTFQLTAVKSPSLKSGEAAQLYVSKPYGFDAAADMTYSLTNTTAFSTKNKDLEKSAKFMDYLYTEEGRRLKNFGVQDVSYTMVGEKPTYTEEIANNAEGRSMNEMIGKYCRATSPNPGFGDDPYYIEQYYKYPQQLEAMDIFAENLGSAVAFDLPPVTPLEEEVTEMSTLQATIDTYQEEMFAKFIMGTEPIENFDKYVATLQSMKIDRILEIYKNAMQRYELR
ncbi:MAG: extracellular solute-binding protein [Clostridia bacterium]|nr:extracellular solute-binding protein [Clostridia bacterium]